MTTDTVTSFSDLSLDKSLLKSIKDLGYETPSAIQAEAIPLLIDGRDIIGQAQTGTGKTAAFALPILSNLDLKQKDPQVLVLAPTRELAIQVAEAFQKYAKNLKGFHVLPVYGGQDYRGQISALKRGVHVVVGTPGRVMDHMRRGTMNLENLKVLVLDEADEMLRMGFIDDVEWVLEQTPNSRQIALFSATMPQQIRRIATKYLNNPEQVTIKQKTATASTIRQRFWPVSGVHKLDALTRILEAEEFDAMIIFVRTKNSTVELADKLEARGYAAAAINGDIQQKQRERSVQSLKNGKLDILVATDVAARGLDVPRISHVLNYDIPHDTESYIHRIGRTGRAGREGDAILFVAPREKRLLSAIERATKKSIEMMELPSTELINEQRIDKFKQRISETLESQKLDVFRKMIEDYQKEHDTPELEIAAALAHLLQGQSPFLLQNKPQKKMDKSWKDSDRSSDRKPSRRDRERDRGRDRGERNQERGRDRSSRRDNPPAEDMASYRIEVGNNHDVKPGNIVGAIANEANLDSKNIGHIKIYDDYSLVDLPDGMPKEVFNDLKKVWVSGQQLKISRLVTGDEKRTLKIDKKKSKNRKRDKKNVGKRRKTKK
ncbi:MAG: ATP-dependent RNA helicase [endosymbiont of Galathealinum brachiosum]|uniref:ATP-dependent RNA helicase DeaD n=1 Tax=endosymbiont of Galathealinum brachiosum TaxID=2200906 RepID=A0A370DBP4_9GAMM|nr:MAG: ATP-dependent RNA helicase [endosymbiont of Galathealinum brachiosum]